MAHATAVAFRNVRQLERIRGQREKEKSARIAAEERVAEMKRYAAYFDHLSDGVAILDARACVLSLNPAGQALLDLKPHEAEGRHINTLTNPSDEALLLDVLFAVSKGQVKNDVDLHARTPAGRRLTLSVSAAPLKGDAGDGVAILTLRDVTLQRQMAEELRQTTDFLERLIDSSVDAIIAADMKGQIILFNKAAEAICGYRGRRRHRQAARHPALPGGRRAGADEEAARARVRRGGAAHRRAAPRSSPATASASPST